LAVASYLNIHLCFRQKHLNGNKPDTGGLDPSLPKKDKQDLAIGGAIILQAVQL
jgi:hypothetical protein